MPLILSIFVSDYGSQKKIMLFWCIILTLFRGLRWQLGTDWDWYERSFDEINLTNFYNYTIVDSEEGEKILEVGWGLLLLICKLLFGTYTSFLIITNALRCFFIYKSSCMFSRQPIICFVFIMVSENFFPVRQDLANVIYLYGFCMLLKKYSKYYFICNLIAALIHQTAYILLPIYWVYNKIRWRYLVYLSIIVISFMISGYAASFIIPLMIDLIGKVSPQMSFVLTIYYNNGATDINDLNLSNPYFPLILNIAFLSIFYYYLITKNGAKYIYHNYSIEECKNIALTFIGIFVFSVTINNLFLSTMPPISRMSSYLSMSAGILMSMSFMYFTKIKVRNWCCLLLMLYLLYRLYKHGNFYPELMFPYKSIFGVF